MRANWIRAGLSGGASARFGSIFAAAFALSALDSTLGRGGEHWLVKRQALRSFGRVSGFRSEEERSAVLAGIDPRAITTSRLSDSELVERVLHAN